MRRARTRMETIAAVACVSMGAGLVLAQACTSESVTAVDIGSVDVSPASSTVVAGLAVTFEATVYDGRGAVLSAVPVQWSSDRDDVATVDGAGVATGLTPGVTTIRASFSDASASASLTVTPGPTVGITPSSVVLYGGSSGPPPGAVTLRVTNRGGGEVADVEMGIAYPEGAAEGWLSGELASSTVPTDLTLRAASDGMAVGRYDATVTITSADADDDDVPATAAVTLSLTAFTVTESGGGTQVAEYGRSDSVGVVLDSAPASDVSILVVSDDTDEVRVSPTRLTFTPSSWNVARMVTLSAVGDADVDGNQTTRVTLSVDALRSDIAYGPAVDRVVSVITVDGDAEGLAIAESQGGTTVTEAGSVDAFTVVLTARPSADVVLDVTSADAGEVAMSPTTLTFTPADWSSPQPVSVRGVDDEFLDGDTVTPVTVSVDDDRSAAEYRGVASAVVSVTTLDDDGAGLVILESNGGTAVSESGTEDTFTLALTARPTSPVVLDVVSGDPSEAVVSPTRLTFTGATWNEPRTVTVTGVDDDLTDGNQEADITVRVDAAASDDTFDDVPPRIVRVTIADDDAPGFTITSGSTVSLDEAGGTGRVTLVLNTQPSSDVALTFRLPPSSPVLLDPDRLTFRPASWNVPQSVTLTAVDDDVVGGDRTTTVVVGVDAPVSDGDFGGVADQLVAVTLADDDLAGFTLGDTTGLQVGEAGGTDTFTAVLDGRPLSDVVLIVTSGDVGEATATPSALTFSPASWADPQTVTLAGVDDALLDGDRVTVVTVAVDPAASDDAFDGVVLQTVGVTTTDDDLAGLVLVDTLGLTVSEAGGSDAFRVSLANAPASDVVLTVTSGDSGELVAAPATLTFTPANWSVLQPVILTAVDDALLDGDRQTIVTVAVNPAASDDAFDDVADRTVTVTTTDDDVTGFTLADTTGLDVGEGGDTDTFTAVLDARPLSDVVLTVTSGDVGEATATPSALVFTPATWADPQTVTLTGVDDPVIDGDQETIVTVAVDPAASDDAFDDAGARSVTVTTRDDDLPGFTLADTTGLSVSEGGGTDTFTAVLDARPITDVVLTVTAGDVAEATASPSALTFTSSDWNVPQEVTVTGVDDALVDGDRQTVVTVAVDPTTSDDAFDGVAPRGVSVTTTDDDAAGITVSPDVLTVAEAGGVGVFTVRLDSQPLSDVVLDVSSLDPAEVSAGPLTLTFTSSDWNVPQEVTVTGVDDAIVDGDRQTRVLVVVNAAGSDPSYSSVPAHEVVVTTIDDDESETER